MDNKFEIESFEKAYYESPEFWKDEVIFDLDNKARIEETINLIPKDVEKLIDIGCGNGIFVNTLKDRVKGLKIVATDRSTEALKQVRVESFLSDIKEIPIQEKSFDCVCCLQVLEHIPYDSYEQAVKELARISKKYILISVPYMEKTNKNVTTCPKCNSTFNVDLHLRSYDDKILEFLFEKYGFYLVQKKNTIKVHRYYGYSTYIKLRTLFSKMSKKDITFRSPICPVCGYSNLGFNKKTQSPIQSKKPTVISKLKEKIKSFLPQYEVPGYWMICLYRND